MESIKLKISGIRAIVVKAPALTSGMFGVKAEFEFDSAWDGLTKTVVYKANNVIKDDIGITNISDVPYEVLEKPGCTLYIGVYGAAPDGTIILPTIWAAAGDIRQGAAPSGDESVNPSLPVWQQLLDNDRRQDAKITSVDKKIGDIDTALDRIIAIQESLIGGNSL